MSTYHITEIDMPGPNDEIDFEAEEAKAAMAEMIAAEYEFMLANMSPAERAEIHAAAMAPFIGPEQEF